MKKILLLLILIIFISGCTSIKDIKEDTDKYIGKTVTLTGTSSKSIKLGSLSGFTLTDNEGNSISISSETLPKDNTRVSVTGVVMKDTLFGTYILAKEVR